MKNSKEKVGVIVCNGLGYDDEEVSDLELRNLLRSFDNVTEFVTCPERYKIGLIVSSYADIHRIPVVQIPVMTRKYPKQAYFIWNVMALDYCRKEFDKTICVIVYSYETPAVKVMKKKAAKRNIEVKILKVGDYE